MKKLSHARRDVPATLTAAEIAAIDGGGQRDPAPPEEAPPPPPPPPPRHDKPKWRPQPQYRP
jgi:hypothetical protein